MTGYGKASCELPGKKVTVEIKSLNSKQLDLSMRLPSLYREKELEVRSYLVQQVSRGKVDFSVYVENVSGGNAARIDESVVAQYFAQLSSLADRLHMGSSDFLRTILSLPDVVKTEQPELGDEEWAAVFSTIERAVASFVAFREQEGRSLDADFHTRLGLIRQYAAEVPKYEKERIDKVRARIVSNIEEVISKDKVDGNRLEQELIYYIEKLDINEEKVRLANHLRYFEETLTSDPQAGKKLGFIAQEMGREINTLGSKANQADMQKLVVMMKDELEKIKEQVLNVL